MTELDLKKVFATDRAITAVIYTLLGAAALILVFAGATAPAADLGDGYYISYKDEPATHTSKTPVLVAPAAPLRRTAAVPLPTPRPIDAEKAYERPSLPEPLPSTDVARRALLLRCTSYFFLAANVVEKISQEEADVYRDKARRALKESLKPGIAGQDWKEASDKIFNDVYWEYKTSAGADGLGDRYDETCRATVGALQ